MIVTGQILLLLLLAYAAYCAYLGQRLGISFRQALFYTPLKLFARVEDSSTPGLRGVPAPVIYVITHRSKLDPALALSLLPDDTLHILDVESAGSAWLEPYRALGRTIAFNAAHLFVNRRLVRQLRGGGRLAVYLPEGIQPDTKEFRLYRAVSRIAESGRATIVPLHFAREGGIGGRLRVTALPAKTILELAALNGNRGTSHALYARVIEARDDKAA